MTIQDWLEHTFAGFDPSQVEGINDWGGVRILAAHIMSSHGSALLQFTCGGDAFVRFTPEYRYGRPLWLVRDDTAGRVWDSKRNQPLNAGSRPFAKLRLVQTA